MKDIFTKYKKYVLDSIEKQICNIVEDTNK
jgi:hypothetical protein